MKKLFIYLSILFILISCERETILNVDDISFEEDIYLSGDVSSDSIYVFISRSKSRSNRFSNSINPNDTSAIIEVYENNSIFCQLDYKKQFDQYGHESGGYYSSMKKPVMSNTYQIKVKHKEKEMIAKVTIPTLVQFDSVSVDTITVMQLGMVYDSITTCYNQAEVENKFYRFVLTFSDPINEKNFYITKDGSLFNKSNPFYSDPILEMETRNINSEQEPVFSDKLINGKGYQFKFDYYQSNNDTINIRLYSITEDYYLYTKSINLYNANKNDIYSEPVIPYFNVNNGSGIIGGYSYSEVVLYPGGKYKIVK